VINENKLINEARVLAHTNISYVLLLGLLSCQENIAIESTLEP